MMKEHYFNPARGQLLGTATETAPPPKSRSNEVSEQLEALGVSLARLHSFLSEIESRLTPVIRPIPAGGAESAQTGQAMCHVANEIHGHCCGVDSASARVLQILDRLGL